MAAFTYPSSQAPTYRKSHLIILGLLTYAWFAIGLNVLYCRWVNKRKVEGHYDKYINSGDDRVSLVIFDC